MCEQMFYILMIYIIENHEGIPLDMRNLQMSSIQIRKTVRRGLRTACVMFCVLTLYMGVREKKLQNCVHVPKASVMYLFWFIPYFGYSSSIILVIFIFLISSKISPVIIEHTYDILCADHDIINLFEDVSL